MHDVLKSLNDLMDGCGLPHCSMSRKFADMSQIFIPSAEQEGDSRTPQRTGEGRDILAAQVDIQDRSIGRGTLGKKYVRFLDGTRDTINGPAMILHRSRHLQSEQRFILDN